MGKHGISLNFFLINKVRNFEKLVSVLPAPVDKARGKNSKVFCFFFIGDLCAIREGTDAQKTFPYAV